MLAKVLLGGLKGKKTISKFRINIGVWEHTCCFVAVTVADVAVTEILFLWSQSGTVLYCTAMYCSLVATQHIVASINRSE
jgi:hypothetical protein